MNDEKNELFVPIYFHLFLETQCVPIPGLGFRRGSYKCICRRGFYYPDVKSMLKFFNGSTVEEEYAKLMQVSDDCDGIEKFLREH